MTTTSTSGAVDTARELAPWRSGLAWWIVLVEGVVVAIIGLLVLLNPRGANQNLALIFTGALAVAGLLQLWSVFRNRVPETADSLVSGRASVALFAGLVILLLFFRDNLIVAVGLTTVGLASLIYGLLGLVLMFKWRGAGQRVAIIEMIFFIVVGVLMLYAQLGGADELQTITRDHRLALLAGAGLIAFAFYRRSQVGQAEDTASEASGATGTEQPVGDAATHG